MKSEGKGIYRGLVLLAGIILCITSYRLGIRQGRLTAGDGETTDGAAVGPAAAESAAVLESGLASDAGKGAGLAAQTGVRPGARSMIESEQRERLMRNLEANLAMPGMSRIIQEQQRVLMADQYRDLIETLGLNEKEKAYFLDLLTARQMYHVDMGMKLMTGMLSEDERNALLVQVGAGIDEMNKEIDWFLNNANDSDYFQYYECTEGERTFVDAVSTRLSQAGNPLAEGLDKELVAIMHEEISAYPFSVQFEENGEPVFANFTGGNIDTFVREMQDMRDPMMRKAAEVLSPEQVKTFSGSFDQYVAFYDQRLRMVQQLFNPAQ